MSRPTSTATTCGYLSLLLCAALIVSPLLVPRSKRGHAIIPAALGAIGLLATILTEIEPIEGFRPTRDLSEAVVDPDIGSRTG